MLGFLIGIGCLIALFKLSRRGGYRRRCGGWRGRGWDDWEGERRPRGPMRWVIRRLDLSPDQARVVRAEASSLGDQAHHLKRAIRRSGEDVARAVRAESFDAEVMGEVFAAHDDAIREARKALVASMARVHDVLDPDQRERVADWLASGRGPAGGPYRGWM